MSSPNPDGAGARAATHAALERAGVAAAAVDYLGPLFGHMRRAGLVQGDELGLGLVTQRCAVIGADGEPSPWLLAVGGLTRPSLWEVTAVPAINPQIHALASRLTHAPMTSPLDLVFADLGAGI